MRFKLNIEALKEAELQFSLVRGAETIVRVPG